MTALDLSSPVAVVGTGTMGQGIAQVALVAGHPVRLYDAAPGRAQEAADAIGAFAVIRRRGAHSVLCEMSWLPDAEEASVLRQALAIPIARAVWRESERLLRHGRAA